MRFLIDACTSSRRLVSYLEQQRHEVLSVALLAGRTPDADVLRLALHDDRILLTDDKDFGELVFAKGLPHGPIVRFVSLTAVQQIERIEYLLKHHAGDLKGPVVIVVAAHDIRIRRQDSLR